MFFKIVHFDTSHLVPHLFVLATRVCPVSQFQCDGSRCLSSDRLCNGQKDCDDGEDETPVFCDHRKCLPLQWRCGTGQCIRSSQRCDGSNHCWDGTDEEDCGN